jgi:DNA-binding NarL/FixJ family response regulator
LAWDLRPASPTPISPAEQRVLAVLSRGASNREIAATLYLSVRTVESHISSLLAKTGCRNRTQLALRGPLQP